MNKKLIKGLSAALCTLLSVTMITGCGGDTVDPSGGDDDNTTTTKTYDTESRAFTMAIGAIDGNFNPFFYTAQNDGTVASMTQVSMLTTDASGNAICGEDYPTVAKDYSIVENDNDSTSSTGTSTTYRFLIKNGMKDSMGYDFNVMDALFSYYTYLDIAYTGSVTLYSTDIKGLNAYRQQDANLSDTDTNDNTSTFEDEAQQRLDKVIAYLNNKGTLSPQVEEDIATIKALFLEEITSDWTTIESSFSSSYTEDSFEYRFGEGEAWKYYYLNEGIISVYTTYNSNGKVVQLKDENDKYVTTIEDWEDYATYVLESKSDVGDEMEEIINDEEKIAQAMKDYKTSDRDEAIEYLKKETAINTVYETKTSSNEGLLEIIYYWSTGSDVLEQFVGEARTEYYNTKKEENGGLEVETITGITVERVTEFTDNDGNTYALDGQYDVLQIVINDIDPKAIYNFAITVCPMHYYSDEEHYEAAMADYQKYLAANGNYTITEFGVEMGDSTWYSDVVQDSEKNRNPVGAGAYATSNQDGGTGTASTFWTNKYVYYTRNNYFHTMGTGIENAKIKYVQYREMGDDKVLNALINEEVDYGTPTANYTNQTELSKYSSYLDATTLYDTSGYGYIGINPKYVPEYQVRQAIIKALNTKMTVSNYYTSEYASVIYRPMSKTSWAYPDGCTTFVSSLTGTSYAYTTQTDEIIALVEEAGYVNVDSSTGLRSNSSGDTLKFTFTIAGESTDHPAYQMFLQAEKILEQCGFDITVQTNVNALKDLNSGNLAVWAAAWTSSVDPDMYQIYHKDSTASSVKNWNYNNILKNSTEWQYEYDIIQDLSDYIDLARTTNNQSTRKSYYAKALDLVMELAVELPTYQRKDNEVFNSTILDRSSMTANPSTYVSLIDRIWEVDYL